MTYQRSYHTATLLNNGKVLVAGGVSAGVNTELYDPVTNSWTATSNSMTYARFDHTATLLPNGKVLVTGGYDVAAAIANAGTSNYVVPSMTSAELYDPATGLWTPAGNMAYPRAKHTATLLASGKVLIAGGVSATSSYSTTYSACELYDPVSNTWSTTGSMSQGRNSHTATLMPDGKVLVTGGDKNYGNITNGTITLVPTNTAELYDPTIGGGAWSTVASMATARLQQNATLLNDGRVLIAGGQDGSNSLSSVETFTAPTAGNANGTWTTVASMKWARKLFTSTLLSSGNVLVTGGENNLIIYSAAEQFDPVKGSWSDTSGYMTASRFAHTATKLQSGKVLLTGGTGISSEMSSAELFQP